MHCQLNFPPCYVDSFIITTSTNTYMAGIWSVVPQSGTQMADHTGYRINYVHFVTLLMQWSLNLDCVTLKCIVHSFNLVPYSRFLS